MNRYTTTEKEGKRNSPTSGYSRPLSIATLFNVTKNAHGRDCNSSRRQQGAERKLQTKHGLHCSSLLLRALCKHG